MTKIEFKFAKLQKALKSLEAIYLKTPRKDRCNIDATIQRFKFTFELFWKLLKEFFIEKGLEVNYPKETIREAFAARIISNEDIWIQMLNDRNMTSHTYDEQLADEIFFKIRDYVPEMRKTFDYLAAKLQEL